jgi:hypothetical protein
MKQNKMETQNSVGADMGGSYDYPKVNGNGQFTKIVLCVVKKLLH